MVIILVIFQPFSIACIGENLTGILQVFRFLQDFSEGLHGFLGLVLVRADCTLTLVDADLEPCRF